MRTATSREVRQLLRDITRRSDMTLARMARILGREPAWMQRFVREGRPATLDDGDRRRLSDYLGIDPRRLGGE